MGLCMIFAGVTYALVGLSTSLGLMLFFVFIAHAASGANWVMSTVLLQRRTPDTYRGRIFSTEWLLFTLAQSASVIVASTLLEQKLFTIQEVIIFFAIMLAITGVIWNFTVTKKERVYQENLATEPGYQAE